MLERGEVVDVLFGEDECLVLLEHQCLRLTAVAAAIVAHLDRPRTREDVEANLEGLFGTAPEGRVQQVIGDLVQQGVLLAADAVRPEEP